VSGGFPPGNAAGGSRVTGAPVVATLGAESDAPAAAMGTTSAATQAPGPGVAGGAVGACP